MNDLRVVTAGRRTFHEGCTPQNLAFGETLSSSPGREWGGECDDDDDGDGEADTVVTDGDDNYLPCQKEWEWRAVFIVRFGLTNPRVRGASSRSSPSSRDAAEHHRKNKWAPKGREDMVPVVVN